MFSNARMRVRARSASKGCTLLTAEKLLSGTIQGQFIMGSDVATRSILSVPIRRQAGGSMPVEDQDFVAVEEPLQIRIGDRNISVTMRTPGQDAELTAGFLFSEGILRPGQIAKTECISNTATVTLTPGVELDDSALQRNFYMTSSCGVCGKASVESIE